MIISYDYNQTWALRSKMDPGSGSHGSGSEIHWDHRSVSSIYRGIQWDHRSYLWFCRGIRRDHRSKEVSCIKFYQISCTTQAYKSLIRCEISTCFYNYSFGTTKVIFALVFSIIQNFVAGSTGIIDPNPDFNVGSTGIIDPCQYFVVGSSGIIDPSYNFVVGSTGIMDPT